MIENLKRMAIFAEVVDAGSFSGAAKNLGVSASVISTHVSQLEQTLGESLFYRSTRQLSLTTFGESFYAKCQNMLKEASEGLSLAANADIKKKFTITIPVALSTPFFMRWLDGFFSQYNNVTFNLIFDDHQLNIIGSNIDVSLRLGWLKDSNMKARKIFEVERHIICSAATCAEIGEISHPEQLVKQNWIGYVEHDVKYHMQTKSGEEYSFAIESNVKVNSSIATKALITSGKYFTILPEIAIRDELDSGQWVNPLPNWFADNAALYVVWPNTDATNQLTREFIDYLTSEDNPN